MFKQIHFLIGCTTLVGAMSFPLLSYAQAQINQQSTPIGQATPGSMTRPVTQTQFEGRGVAHGSVFSRGKNINTSLTVDRDRFTFVMAQSPGTRARARYQGAVVRQNNTSTPNSFTLDGRVQTFDSSASTRIFSNTTGTCRIEVFDSRVISSNCRSVAADSTTQFLGLEQF
jgi:hypothetical protein